MKSAQYRERVVVLCGSTGPRDDGSSVPGADPAAPARHALAPRARAVEVSSSAPTKVSEARAMRIAGFGRLRIHSAVVSSHHTRGWVSGCRNLSVEPPGRTESPAGL